MKTYNTIIIGSGVAGLVCGCYLAKAGLKVLIIEQYSKPGGYCTSFERQGFKFDVGVHYIGSNKNEGDVERILEDLSLNINFIRVDPTDKIILPEHNIYIRKDLRETIENFKINFKKEENNIKKFFNFIQYKDILSIYNKTKNMNFSNLLDNFFSDYKLKATFSVLLGNIGLSSKDASAFTSVIFYRQYILDGGYYPKGGVQSIPDALVSRFKSYGGELFFSSRIKKIITKNKKVDGVYLKGEKYFSDFIVLAGDVTNIFQNLIDIECVEQRLIKRLTPSTPCFVLYLGLNKDLKKILKDHCSTWFFTTYDIDSCYSSPFKKNFETEETNYILCTFPSLHESLLAPKGKSTMGILICAPYKSKDFWRSYKEQVANSLINKAKLIIPNLQKYIEIKIIATPYTFYKFTSNREGSPYGWASTPNQIDSNIFPQKTSIEGLLVAGHWCTHGAGQGGVSVSMYSGRRAASLILNIKKKSF